MDTETRGVKAWVGVGYGGDKDICNTFISEEKNNKETNAVKKTVTIHIYNWRNWSSEMVISQYHITSKLQSTGSVLECLPSESSALKIYAASHR